MALQIAFFMSPADEVELFRKLERLEVELWPEFSDPALKPPRVSADAASALEGPAYYFAMGDVQGYLIKRGKERGQWKIDEVKSPVVYFCRSVKDEDGELRSGYFWVELEGAGDNSRMGGKPAGLRRLINELESFLKVRYRKSSPVKGQMYFIGPGAARLSQAGTVLRQAGRKGEVVVPYR